MPRTLLWLPIILGLYYTLDSAYVQGSFLQVLVSAPSQTSSVPLALEKSALGTLVLLLFPNKADLFLPLDL